METYGTYEFSRAENEVIAFTTRQMGLWGIISFVLGVTAVVAALTSDSGVATAVAGLAQGVVNMAVGAFFFSSSRLMKKVAITQGDDMKHFIVALQRLGDAFVFQVIAVAISVAIFLGDGLVRGF